MHSIFYSQQTHPYLSSILTQLFCCGTLHIFSYALFNTFIMIISKHRIIFYIGSSSINEDIRWHYGPITVLLLFEGIILEVFALKFLLRVIVRLVYL